MGTWACPDTKDKAVRLAAILDKPLMASEAVTKLRGLLGDDDLGDSIQDAVRPGEPDRDVSWLVAEKLREWLGELETFVTPWEPEAIHVVEKAVLKVQAQFDADIKAIEERQPTSMRM